MNLRFLSKLALAVFALTLGGAIPASSDACGGQNTPAFPVPEFREGARMWTGTFGPATPGVAIPADRDSTAFAGHSQPGAGSGHEHFRGIAILDNLAFVAYNYGISIWQLDGAFAANPQKIKVCDGWNGGPTSGCWMNPVPISSEVDDFVTGITAIRHPSDSDLILLALSGQNGVGNTLWKWRKSTFTLTQLLQDSGPIGLTVDVATLGSTTYAFVGSHNRGILVYDLTAAAQRSTPCVQGSGGCNYLLGAVDPGTYSDIAAISDGSKIAVFGSSLFAPPKLWQLNTANVANSFLRYTGPTGSAIAPEFFRKSGKTFLALIDGTQIRVHDVDACITSGCGSLGTARATRTYTNHGSMIRKDLTYSESDGTPFLYFGFGAASAFLKLPNAELLMDLSSVTPTGAGSPVTLIDETERAGFETYDDPCDGGTQNIGYWGDMYPGNNFGLNGVFGKTGMFNGNYFYRIAYLLFDVHQRNGGAPPEPELEVSLQPPAPSTLWLDSSIGFQAVASSCQAPAPFDWQRSHAGVGSSTSSTIQLVWPLCASGTYDCDLTGAWVQATAEGCDPDATDTLSNLSILDPRPVLGTEILAEQSGGRGTVLDQCAPTALGIDAAGRSGSFDWSWTAQDVACEDFAATRGLALDCSVALVDPDGLDQSGEETPLWAARELRGDFLFADGFEEGSVSAWGTTPLYRVRVAVDATYTSQHEVVPTQYSNPAGPVETILDFAAAPGPRVDTLTATPTEAGTLLLATTGEAFEYRWEIEDAAGNAAGTFCTFDEASVPCVVHEWGEMGASVAHTWTSDDGNGSSPIARRFRVSVRTCDPASVVSAASSETITPVQQVDPATVTAFYLPDDQLSGPGPGSTPCYWDFGQGYVICDDRVTFEACTALGEADPTSFLLDKNGTAAGGVVSVPASPIVSGSQCDGQTEKAWLVDPNYAADVETSFRPTIQSVRGSHPHPDGPFTMVGNLLRIDVP